jgi:Lrp/AsnC family leucine-responsive transcriptional regulator
MVIVDYFRLFDGNKYFIMLLSELDATDVRILQLLQVNARRSNKEIGVLLHKSASTINERVRKLEDQGFITNYIAVIDPDKVNLDFITFTHVQLKDHSKESLNHFEAEIVQFQEVLECYHMSGDYDFIIRVATANKQAYHEFLMNKLFAILSVGKVQTTLIMKVAKTGGALPILR